MFDRSALPPAQAFYESEGFKLSRPNSKGWAMCQGRPPCHKSKSGRSFSVNVNHGGYRCFGCGAHGDQFDYVSRRDGCDLITASKILGCSRPVTPAEQVDIVRRKQEREVHRQREAEEKEAERQERLKIREHLHAVDTLYREAIQEHDWQLMSELLPRLREAEAAYCRAAELENPYYEQ